MRFSEDRLNTHKLSELPYHQTFGVPENALKIDEATARNFALFDFEFIEAKGEAGMWEQMDDDFTNAAGRITDPQVQEFK